MFVRNPAAPSPGGAAGLGQAGTVTSLSPAGGQPLSHSRTSQGYWWHHPQDITSLWERDCCLQGGEQRFSIQPLDSAPTLAVSACRPGPEGQPLHTVPRKQCCKPPAHMQPRTMVRQRRISSNFNSPDGWALFFAAAAPQGMKTLRYVDMGKQNTQISPFSSSRLIYLELSVEGGEVMSPGEMEEQPGLATRWLPVQLG